jgi:hypothetical protein
MDFSTLFALGDKDAVLRDMITSMKGFFSAGEGRQKYSAAWRSLAAKFAPMLASQSTEVRPKVDTLCDLLQQLADAEDALGVSEIRAAEDFRDVIARYDVLFRRNEEYLQAKREFRLAKDALARAKAADTAESTKASYEKSKYRLQAAVFQARDILKKTIEIFRGRTEALIDTRNRYTAFKIRRLAHGWTLYGNALRQNCEAELGILQQVKDVLAELRSAGEIAAEVVGEVEETIGQQLAEAPAAAQPIAEGDSVDLVPVFALE